MRVGPGRREVLGRQDLVAQVLELLGVARDGEAGEQARLLVGDVRPHARDEALQERLEVEVRGRERFEGLHDLLGLGVRRQLAFHDGLAVVEALADHGMHELLLRHGVADESGDDVVDEGLAADRFVGAGLQFGEGRFEGAVVGFDHADEVGVPLFDVLVFDLGHCCLLWGWGRSGSWGREGRRESPPAAAPRARVRSGWIRRGRR